MKSHKDLDAWKNSINLVTDIYKMTESFPSSEQFGLTSQLRRSAVSIPSNIAKGAGRNHTKEFIQFLYFSQGSLSELETQLIISFNLKYIPQETLDEHISATKFISSQIYGLIRYLKKIEK